MRDTQPVPIVKTSPKLSLVEAASARYAAAQPAQSQRADAAFLERAQERLKLLQNSGLNAAPTSISVRAPLRVPAGALVGTSPTFTASAFAPRRTLPIHLAWGAVCALLCAALVWQSTRLAAVAVPDASSKPRLVGGPAASAPSDTAPQLRLSTELSRIASQP